MHEEKEEITFTWLTLILPSAELQALYLEVSSAKRLPHLEWDLIGQLFLNSSDRFMVSD